MGLFWAALAPSFSIEFKDFYTPRKRGSRRLVPGFICVRVRVHGLLRAVIHRLQRGRTRPSRQARPLSPVQERASPALGWQLRILFRWGRITAFVAITFARIFPTSTITRLPFPGRTFVARFPRQRLFLLTPELSLLEPVAPPGFAFPSIINQFRRRRDVLRLVGLGVLNGCGARPGSRRRRGRGGYANEERLTALGHGLRDVGQADIQKTGRRDRRPGRLDNADAQAVVTDLFQWWLRSDERGPNDQGGRQDPKRDEAGGEGNSILGQVHLGAPERGPSMGMGTA